MDFEQRHRERRELVGQDVSLDAALPGTVRMRSGSRHELAAWRCGLFAVSRTVWTSTRLARVRRPRDRETFLGRIGVIDGEERHGFAVGTQRGAQVQRGIVGRGAGAVLDFQRRAARHGWRKVAGHSRSAS